MNGAGGAPRSIRYRPLGLLGQGGHAHVWRVLDTHLQVERAIKRLDDKDAVSKEAQAMASFEHPHVVRVYDTFVDDDGYTCVVMELLSASLADAVITRGSLSPRRAVDALVGPLDALATAHKGGLVHRDVKPSNLLVDAHGNTRLSDFGVARILGQETTTSTGAVIGTVAFMAPEQREDPRLVGPPADVYAAAATLLWLIRSEVPVDPYVPEQRARWATSLPEPLRRVLDRALAWNPETRYPDAGALRDALLDVRDSLPERGDGDALIGVKRIPLVPPPPQTRAKTSNNRVPMWGTAALGLGGPAFGVLATLAWLATPSVEATKPILCERRFTAFTKQTELGPREALSATIEDVDQDGHSDLLYVNQLDETLSIRWGLGDRAMPPADDVPIGRAWTAPGVGDVDGDGYNDLVVARSDEGTLAILRGLPRRTFAPATMIFQPEEPLQPKVADWDGDGIADLIVRLRPCVAWRKGLGQGAFASHACLVEELPAQQIDLTDLDGDGHLDLLATVDHHLEVWFGAEGAIRQRLTLEHAAVQMVRVVTLGDQRHAFAWTPDRRPLYDVSFANGALTACDAGALPVTLDGGTESVGDLDGDGNLDTVTTDTCAGCTSNHILFVGQAE